MEQSPQAPGPGVAPQGGVPQPPPGHHPDMLPPGWGVWPSSEPFFHNVPDPQAMGSQQGVPQQQTTGGQQEGSHPSDALQAALHFLRQAYDKTTTQSHAPTPLITQHTHPGAQEQDHHSQPREAGPTPTTMGGGSR